MADSRIAFARHWIAVLVLDKRLVDSTRSLLKLLQGDRCTPEASLEIEPPPDGFPTLQQNIVITEKLQGSARYIELPFIWYHDS
jgi:hypothetical protein